MTLRRFFRDTSGATAVETALISLPLITLTFGIIEIGRALYMQQALSFGADRAARILYINPTATESAMEQAVVDSVFFVDPLRLDVSLDLAPTTVNSEDFSTRRLTVTYDFVSLVPSILTGTIKLSSDRHVVIRKPATP